MEKLHTRVKFLAETDIETVLKEMKASAIKDKCVHVTNFNGIRLEVSEKTENLDDIAKYYKHRLKMSKVFEM